MTTINELTDKLWESLENDDPLEEILEEQDDFTVQQVLNSPRDGQLMVEYLCENSHGRSVCEIMNWLIEHGAVVTENCYRSLLRRGQDIELLSCLVNSGHFPERLGTTFTLDWIVDVFESASDDNTEITSDPKLEKILLKLFKLNKAECEARGQSSTLVSDKAFAVDGSFMKFVKRNASCNEQGNASSEWYDMFGIDEVAGTQNENMVRAGPAVEEAEVNKSTGQYISQQTPATKATPTSLTPKVVPLTSFSVTPAVDSLKGLPTTTPKATLGPKALSSSLITPTPKRSVPSASNHDGKRVKLVH